MCGIVGILASTAVTDKQIQLFANLLYVDKLRGEHATGIAKINPFMGKVSVHKRALGATKFLALEETAKFLDQERGRILIGHNRYATMGNRGDDANAHPFQEDHITLVHNGTVDAWTMKDLHGFSDKDINVDSHMVCKTIAELGIEEAVTKKLSGAFALVYWDQNERSLNMIRNSQRPLWLAALSDRSLIWASEREFMDCFVNRKKSAISYASEPIELPTDLLHTWKFSEHGVLLNDGNPVVKKLVFAKVPDPSPAYTGYYGMGGNARRSADVFIGRNSGVESFNDRVNRILDDWKIEERIHERIVFEVEDYKPHSVTTPNSGYISGAYNGIEVTMYTSDYERWKDAKFGWAEICNAREVRAIYEGHEYDDLTITVSSVGAQPLTKEEAEAKKQEWITSRQSKISTRSSPEPKSGGTNLVASTSETTATKVVTDIRKKFPIFYPLKVNGFQFRSAEQFADFVSDGCAQCGGIPHPHHQANRNITVYKLGKGKSGKQEYAFICGECVSEDR